MLGLASFLPFDLLQVPLAHQGDMAAVALDSLLDGFDLDVAPVALGAFVVLAGADEVWVDATASSS